MTASNIMPDMKNAQAIMIGIVIGVLSGIGFVHLTIAGDVQKHETKITQLEKDRDSDRERLDQRIYEVAELVKEVLASNRELISILRMQSELLRQKNEK